MKLIPLTQGQFAKVDDEDFALFGSMKWCATWDRHTKSFYARRTDYSGSKQRTVRLHREIVGCPAGSKVDHINHDTLDCRRENLRICTNAQNGSNRRGPNPNCKSGVRGVRRRHGYWIAQITVAGKKLHLGQFNRKEDAAIAYATANKKYFSDFGGNIIPGTAMEAR